ncbi:hypothetical protein BTN33_22785 [Aeromonas veronii]|uniref:type II secretion system F family protein n=1 Tax=Aeromonas veronii TaxID=654 RepID=UPI000946B793|nr:type II secretion system F family protein [Aeromonas veronii]OLF56816.1 hypothetical protein BTN33_22785 [Aeromonas veronii]
MTISDLSNNIALAVKAYDKFTFTKESQIEYLEDFKELLESGLEEQAIYLDFLLNGNRKVKSLSQDMLNALRNGQKIDKGMEGWFSPIVTSSVGSGKRAGKIITGLEIAIESLKDSSGMTSDIIKAVSYPLSIITVLISVAGSFEYEYLLDIQGRYPLHKWSTIPHLAWGISSFSHNWGVALYAAMFSLFAFFWWALPNLAKRNELDDVLVFKQYRYLNAISIMSSTSSLMTAGLDLKSCMKIVSHGANKWLKEKLRAIDLKIASGKSNLGEIFDVGLIDKQEVSRLKSLSLAENKASVLMKSAVRQRRKLKKQIQRIAFISKVFSMLIAGMGIAIIASGTYVVSAQAARVIS